MRASHLLAFAAVALILALAGCGGGGGGGGGSTTPVTPTADVTGQVVDETGTGIDGATVSAEVDRAIVSTVTSGGGYYTLQDIPTQTNFTLTVTANDTTLMYQNVRLGASNPGGQAPMDIVFTTQTPSAGAGGTDPVISIVPAESQVAYGTSPVFNVRIDYGTGGYIEGYRAIWTVSGATGQISNGGADFVVSPGAVGSTFKLRATVLMNISTGRTISAERTLTVVNGGTEDPPPPPSGT